VGVQGDAGGGIEAQRDGERNPRPGVSAGEGGGDHRGGGDEADARRHRPPRLLQVLRRADLGHAEGEHGGPPRHMPPRPPGPPAPRGGGPTPPATPPAAARPGTHSTRFARFGPHGTVGLAYMAAARATTNATAAVTGAAFRPNASRPTTNTPAAAPAGGSTTCS